MKTYFVFKLCDGNVYRLNVEVIARNRVEYYSKSDEFEQGTDQWNLQYQHSLENDELEDWFLNNMNFEDYQEYIQFHQYQKPTLQELFQKLIQSDNFHMKTMEL